MLFNSGEFFFYFLAILAGYWCLPHRGQNRLLLLASYGFYCFWDWRFLGLILISTVIDYIASNGIFRARERKDLVFAKRLMWLSVAVNLGILGLFKYFNFFAESLTDFVNLFGLSLSPITLDLILPVGISFYTFQTMSYTIDVYRGRQKPVTNAEDFALFVAFFPQLMAGPIERASRLVPQLQKPRKLDFSQWQEGGWLIFWGVFKKVYIADNLAPYSMWAFGGQNLTSGGDAYIAIAAFSIQLYCDFSGYSDMARGLSKLLGVNLTLNFNLPYFATNPADVWQRWHITLGNWIRDYLYMPLTSFVKKTNRKGRFALLVPTMLACGLWHGADYHYVVWGGLWGATIFVYRLLQNDIKRLYQAFPRMVPAFNGVARVGTLHLWFFYTMFFISPTVAYAFQANWMIFTDFRFTALSHADAVAAAFYALPLVLMQLVQWRYNDLNVIAKLPFVGRVALYCLMMMLLITNGSEALSEFIYFQF